jgi:hypothetical protein
MKIHTVLDEKMKSVTKIKLTSKYGEVEEVTV